jgi:hypothetical protein
MNGIPEYSKVKLTGGVWLFKAESWRMLFCILPDAMNLSLPLAKSS